MRPIAALPILSLAFFLVACGSGGGSVSSNPAAGPRVETSQIFSSQTPFVAAGLAACSPDCQKVAFAEATQADVYVVNLSGGTPVKATNYDADNEQGGESPTFLGDGRLVYYRGWQGGDHNMHFMVASSSQVNNSPAATVLRSFNGSDVGMTANSASSPGPLTVSSDGTKGVYGTWLLDWSSGSLVATQIANSTELAIGPEGTHIAWVDAQGSIRIRRLSDQQETLVGSGVNLSWASGTRLGYAVSGAYKVFTLSSGTTRTYPCSLHLDGPGCPVITRNASRIVYRTFGGAYTGLSVGRLVD